MYLYGKNSVFERIKSNPKSIKKIFLENNFNAPHIINAIKSSRVPFERVSEKRLSKIKRADRVQGVAALVDDFKYIEFEELIKSPDKNNSIIFLDNINDPHNLGSIIRTAACFGGFSVVIPSRNSCQVNDTVMHVASGGENSVPISQVNNMTQALLKAKEKGFWLVGTVVKDGKNINKTEVPFPLCLVLGSEGKGIRYGIDKHLDLKISLPMEGAELSLNVAMASAVFCYEISRQRPI